MIVCCTWRRLESQSDVEISSRNGSERLRPVSLLTRKERFVSWIEREAAAEFAVGGADFDKACRTDVAVAVIARDELQR